MTRRNYPATVGECLDGTMRYRRGVLAAVRAFKGQRPWRGGLEARQAKFARLNAALANAYGLAEPVLRFEDIDGSFSGASTCRRGGPGEPAVITLRGRLSVVPYLHEFAHALGRDERGACRWSINLFRRVCPAQFARLATSGHTLRRR